MLHLLADRATKRTSLEDLKKRPIGVYGGYPVFLVNGTALRDNIEIDWTMGGHRDRYLWMPAGEIWIDDALPRRDLDSTVVHEVVEVDNMRHGGLRYGPAHARANDAERLFRQREETVADFLRQYRRPGARE